MSNGSPGYWQRVKAHAKILRGDGCTDVPDFWFRKCCDEHDIHYRTHQMEDGQPVTKAEADAKLRGCIRSNSPLRYVGLSALSPLALIYWGGVRLFGGHAWDNNHSCTEGKLFCREEHNETMAG